MVLILTRTFPTVKKTPPIFPLPPPFPLPENLRVYLAENFHRLLRNAQNGDSRAMDEFLTALRPHLELVARNYADQSRVDESTSDLVQEAWLRAWRKLATFAGGEGDAETQATLPGGVLARPLSSSKSTVDGQQAAGGTYGCTVLPPAGFFAVSVRQPSALQQGRPRRGVRRHAASSGLGLD